MPVSRANSLVQVPPPQTCIVANPCARVRPSASNILRLHSAAIVQSLSMDGSNVLSSRMETMSGCSCALANFAVAQRLFAQAGGLSAEDCVHTSDGSASAAGFGITTCVCQNEAKKSTM